MVGSNQITYSIHLQASEKFDVQLKIDGSPLEKYRGELCLAAHDGVR